MPMVAKGCVLFALPLLLRATDEALAFFQVSSSYSPECSSTDCDTQNLDSSPKLTQQRSSGRSSLGSLDTEFSNDNPRVVIVQYQTVLDETLSTPSMVFYTQKYFGKLPNHRHILYHGRTARVADDASALPEDCRGKDLKVPFALVGHGGCRLHPGWGKVFALIDATTRYPNAEYVMYLDNDIIPNPVLFENPVPVDKWYKDLGDACGEDFRHGEPRLLVGREEGFYRITIRVSEKPNDGAVLLKNSPANRQLLKAWLDTTTEKYVRGGIAVDRNSTVNYRDNWPHAAYPLTRLLNDETYHNGAGKSGLVIPQARNGEVSYEFGAYEPGQEPGRLEAKPFMSISEETAVKCDELLGNLKVGLANKFVQFLASHGARSKYSPNSELSGRGLVNVLLKAESESGEDCGSHGIYFNQEKPFAAFCNALRGENLSCRSGSIREVLVQVKPLKADINDHKAPGCTMQCPFEYQRSESSQSAESYNCYLHHYVDDKKTGAEDVALMLKKMGYDLTMNQSRAVLLRDAQELPSFEMVSSS